MCPDACRITAPPYGWVLPGLAWTVPRSPGELRAQRQQRDQAVNSGRDQREDQDRLDDVHAQEGSGRVVAVPRAAPETFAADPAGIRRVPRVRSGDGPK